MLNQYKECIKDADLVLIGVGRELDAKNLIPMDGDEVRNYYKGKGMHGYEDLLAMPESKERNRLLEAYYRGYLLSMEHFSLYDELAECLEDKNYFVITSNQDNLLYKSNLRGDRICVPCGSGEFFQCGKPCEHKLYPALPGIEALINYYEANGELEWLQCPNCGGDFLFNVRNEDTVGCYVEEGYLQRWGYYTKWLQGTINKKVVILELGEGFELPNLFKWPFEKIVTYNLKSKFIRVHETLAMATPETKERTEVVAKNSREFLLEQ